MIVVIVNVIAVIIGSLVGLLFKKGISQKLTEAVMIGIGLCTIYIGVSGALKGENTLLLIVSIVIGAIMGTWIDLDKKIHDLGECVGKRFKASSCSSVSLAEGFVTGSLLFCAGAMSIVGSLNAGLSGDTEMLFTKSLLDLILSAILSASLGVGVLFSAAFVLVLRALLFCWHSIYSRFLLILLLVKSHVLDLC